MNQPLKIEDSQLTWKGYAKLALESFIAFYIATFCMGYYFTHHLSNGSVIPSIILGFLYAIVIILCVKRVVAKLSAPGMMIIIPIVPLLILIIVLTLIPILQLI